MKSITTLISGLYWQNDIKQWDLKTWNKGKIIQHSSSAHTSSMQNLALHIGHPAFPESHAEVSFWSWRLQNHLAIQSIHHNGLHRQGWHSPSSLSAQSLTSFTFAVSCIQPIHDSSSYNHKLNFENVASCSGLKSYHLNQSLHSLFNRCLLILA